MATTIRFFDSTDWGCDYAADERARWQERVEAAIQAAYPEADVEVVDTDGPQRVVVGTFTGSEYDVAADVREIATAEWDAFCAANFDAEENERIDAAEVAADFAAHDKAVSHA